MVLDVTTSAAPHLYFCWSPVLEAPYKAVLMNAVVYVRCLKKNVANPHALLGEPRNETPQGMSVVFVTNSWTGVSNPQ